MWRRRTCHLRRPRASLGPLLRAMLPCLSLVLAVVAPAEFAEDDVEGMTQYLIASSAYAEPATECSSELAAEEGELCKSASVLCFACQAPPLFCPRTAQLTCSVIHWMEHV